MAVHFGKNARVNYKTGGVGAGGSWTKLNKVRDVTLDEGSNEWDGSTRDEDLESMVPVQRKCEATIQIVFDPADPGHAALYAAYRGSTTIGLQILHKDAGEGPQANFWVPTFQRVEELKAGILVNVTVKHADTYSYVS